MKSTPCIICLMAFILLFTSIATPIVATYLPDETLNQGQTKQTIHQAFEQTLNQTQKQKYKKIIQMRRNIYLQGLLVGIVLSCIVVAIVMHTSPLSNRFVYGCLGVVVLFVSLFLYYILYPKPEYMLDVLNTEKQRMAWLKVYRHMQVSMYGSFAFALVGTFLMFTFVVPCSYL